MGLDNVLCELAKRMKALELAINQIGGFCNCRPGGSITYYHTAADLQAIMAVRCPMHGFRELGDFSYFPADMPLLPEDQLLCKCPPSPVRAYLENKRGYLSDEEQNQHCQTLDSEFSTEEAYQRFAIDQAEVARLIQGYAQDKRNHRRTTDAGHQL